MGDIASESDATVRLILRYHRSLRNRNTNHPLLSWVDIEGNYEGFQIRDRASFDKEFSPKNVTPPAKNLYEDTGILAGYCGQLIKAVETPS